jgi:mono/diheme cytochrome c family protein
MKKSSLVIFGVFAIIFALAIPFLAIEGEGGADASPNYVASSDADAKALFQTNCGTCHTLAAGGTHGVVGPNLDDTLAGAPPDANDQRVLSAVQNGVGGRMPADILSGDEAKQVADFVSRYAGQ